MLRYESKREVSNVVYAINVLALSLLLVLSIVRWRRFIPLWFSVPLYSIGILISLWYWKRNRRGRITSR